MTQKRAHQDETTLTEIRIQPDGRVYVFGPSLGILELLEALAPADPRLQRILKQVRKSKPEDSPTREES